MSQLDCEFGRQLPFLVEVLYGNGSEAARGACRQNKSHELRNEDSIHQGLPLKKREQRYRLAGRAGPKFAFHGFRQPFVSESECAPIEQ
jgi:hypothetical protein